MQQTMTTRSWPREPLSPTAERVWMLPEHQLRYMHRSLLGGRTPSGVVQARANVLRELRTPHDQSGRMYAAEQVAEMIVARWREAGVPGWWRDRLGFPVPHNDGRLATSGASGWFGGTAGGHVTRFVYRTSPSGKSLIGCAHCDLAPAPSLVKPPPCQGKSLDSAAQHIALAIYAGGQYRVDGNGLPVPSGHHEATLRLGGVPVRWCWCCGLFGTLRVKEPAGHQEVCSQCSTEIWRFYVTSDQHPQEIKEATTGRRPY